MFFLRPNGKVERKPQKQEGYGSWQALEFAAPEFQELNSRGKQHPILWSSEAPDILQES